MEGILLVADNHGVAGVVAAVELDDIVDVLGNKVSCLALAFVAPLRTNNH
ncbi:unannotated protein [freshwater metagenome]|uniref:Unannotated protein n=1 Tax=freshwater metagenome TaxID=449393 RepID=A0A6J6JIG8_9ZZZZ